MCDVISIHSSNQLEGIFTAGSKLSKLCDSVFYCDMLWLPFDDHSDAEALTIERTIFLCSVILYRNLMMMIALVVIRGARMLEEAFMIPVFSVS
uniref:Uncharacterized protein n=1 Tax=Triticum urartu TaxID=4572 RepID=A0A8R7U2J4_TRIUA